ncbi:MAG: hypothetical protein AAGE52_22830 [Myxococcota bacterium]
MSSFKAALGALGFFVALVGVVMSAEGRSTETDSSERSLDAGTPGAHVDAGPRNLGRDERPRFAGLSRSCWLHPNSFCNPATNEGCDEGEVCDVRFAMSGMTSTISCFATPATQRLGDLCDDERGLFCEGGLRCVYGECMDSCCEDAECDDGLHCAPLLPAVGSLGVCTDSSFLICAPPGGFCAQPSDCCSLECHVGHCH